jgi:hypothetical protein
MSRLRDWLHRWRVKMCRHEFHYRVRDRRLYLHCWKCRTETPGWDWADVTPPRIVYALPDARHVLPVERPPVRAFMLRRNRPRRTALSGVTE